STRIGVPRGILLEMQTLLLRYFADEAILILLLEDLACVRSCVLLSGRSGLVRPSHLLMSDLLVNLPFRRVFLGVRRGLRQGLLLEHGLHIELRGFLHVAWLLAAYRGFGSICVDRRACHGSGGLLTHRSALLVLARGQHL